MVCATAIRGFGMRTKLDAAFLMVLLAVVGPGTKGWAVDTVESTLETDLVPSPVKFSVLLPDSYETSGKTYPLLFFLHGGGGDNKFLEGLAPIFRDEWSKTTAPEMVVVTPDADRSFYLDYQDGSQKWETFITGPLLAHIRANYRVSKEPKGTFVGGISMGGMGSLRMAFKHLDIFGAILSMEPGIEPAFEWKDVKMADKFWRSPALLEERFGSPFDEAYWAANNPATIVRDNPGTIRDSGIAIYIEAGSEDGFGLDRGTDFLHRVLYDNNIRHEYRYVYGADHIGPTMGPRLRNGLDFLNRIVNPPAPNPQVQAFRRWIETRKKAAGVEE